MLRILTLLITSSLASSNLLLFSLRYCTFPIVHVFLLFSLLLTSQETLLPPFSPTMTVNSLDSRILEIQEILENQYTGTLENRNESYPSPARKKNFTSSIISLECGSSKVVLEWFVLLMSGDRFIRKYLPNVCVVSGKPSVFHGYHKKDMRQKITRCYVFWLHIFLLWWEDIVSSKSSRG